MNEMELYFCKAGDNQHGTNHTKIVLRTRWISKLKFSGLIVEDNDNLLDDLWLSHFFLPLFERHSPNCSAAEAWRILVWILQFMNGVVCVLSCDE